MFASALTNRRLVILPFLWFVASDCDMLPAAAAAARASDQSERVGHIFLPGRKRGGDGSSFNDLISVAARLSPSLSMGLRDPLGGTGGGTDGHHSALFGVPALSDGGPRITLLHLLLLPPTPLFFFFSRQSLSRKRIFLNRKLACGRDRQDSNGEVRVGREGGSG